MFNLVTIYIRGWQKLDWIMKDNIIRIHIYVLLVYISNDLTWIMVESSGFQIEQIL